MFIDTILEFECWSKYIFILLKVLHAFFFEILGVTKWMAGWKKKGWLKSDGEEVANKEELQELDALMGNLNIKWVSIVG